MAQPTRIISFVTGHPPVGVDNCDDCLTKPVISYGEQDVWAVVRESGRVTLYMGHYQAIPDGDNVVAVPIFSAPPRPPFQWELRKVHENIPVEIYYIVDSATNRAWTLTSSAPKTQISLAVLDQDHPNPAQFFQLTPA